MKNNKIEMNEIDFKKVDWEEQKGTGSEMWTPQKTEDELTGVVINIEEHHEFRKSYTILTATNEEIKTPYHKVLQDRLIEVKAGDLVKIIYKGSVSSGKGNPTQLYKVYRAKLH